MSLGRWLLTLGAAAIAGCGHATGGGEPLANRGPGAGAVALAEGDYACSLDEGGYRYPAYRCQVSRRGGQPWLEKVEGSVRFRGAVTGRGAGFAFDGTLYCPWGDCTEHVRTDFAADGAGGYRATVMTQSGPTTITLRHAARGAYGGAGYGGPPRY
jgi:hypothetical protein